MILITDRIARRMDCDRLAIYGIEAEVAARPTNERSPKCELGLRNLIAYPFRQ